MSWKNQLRPASFRGKPFHVPAHTASIGGRRVAVHEFPGKEKPYVEDLGRRSSEFEIEGYVLGGDYLQLKADLIDACSKVGAGELVHPYLGTLTVVCTECRHSERVDEGGVARFTLKFVDPGENRFPSVATDRTTATNTAADSLQAVSEARFAESFTVTGLPAFVSDAAETAVADLVAMLPGTTLGGAAYQEARDLADGLGELVLTPSELAPAFSSVVETAFGLETGIDSLSEAMAFGEQLSVVPASTATRVRQKANQTALTNLLSRTVVAVAARTAVATVFLDRAALELARNTFGSMIETAILSASDAGDRDAYSALRSVRAEVLKELNSRAPTLARSVSLQPAATEPALRIAYRLYGTAERADEISSRNRLRHPGFVPGGRRIEVLSDV
jgi:prophage DNA circulation protein